MSCPASDSFRAAKFSKSKVHSKRTEPQSTGYLEEPGSMCVIVLFRFGPRCVARSPAPPPRSWPGFRAGKAPPPSAAVARHSAGAQHPGIVPPWIGGRSKVPPKHEMKEFPKQNMKLPSICSCFCDMVTGNVANCWHQRHPCEVWIVSKSATQHDTAHVFYLLRLSVRAMISVPWHHFDQKLNHSRTTVFGLAHHTKRHEARVIALE